MDRTNREWKSKEEPHFARPYIKQNFIGRDDAWVQAVEAMWPGEADEQQLCGWHTILVKRSHPLIPTGVTHSRY